MTPGVLTFVLCALPVPASAAPFCFKDQLDRVYNLYVAGTAGPMIPSEGQPPAVVMTMQLDPPTYTSGVGTEYVNGSETALILSPSACVGPQ